MEASTAKPALSAAERKRLLKKASEELPQLDRRYEKALSNLGRIAEGRRPESEPLPK
jgi:hypothetical protein